jgi:hypothetical protein
MTMRDLEEAGTQWKLALTSFGRLKWSRGRKPSTIAEANKR